ncbi:MAG: hypothetical protein ACP5EQ_02215 [Candidatus Cloacimonadia bacterium]
MLDLNKINPLLKLIFVLFNIILLFCTKESNALYVITIITAILLIINFRLLKGVILATLDISPLLFGLFLLGYIFGTSWQDDLLLITQIVLLVALSMIVIQTSSGANFLKNVRAILSHKRFNLIIAYLFGLINFFPILKDQFSDTFRSYRKCNGETITIAELPSVFIHIFSQSLHRVKDLAPKLEVFLGSKFSLSLSYNDLLIPVLMLAQMLLLILI